ncbi:MAG: hypothetical protein J6T24_00865 [Clostridia bacterium]|nr:hypothetical protein [Clostridia bacterium]
MTVCLLADIPVAFVHRYPHFAEVFAAYRTDLAPALTVSVTEGELTAEAKRNPALPPPALELRALYRKFIATLPAYGGFFLHAAFFTVDGYGIAVCAKSGVGKSTHVALWRDLFSERVRIINGDKPLIRRREDGLFLGYGTPMAGKEGWQENTAAPVRAVLFLARAEEDRVSPLTATEAFPLLLSALPPAERSEDLSALLPLTSEFLSSVRLFRAEVTPRLPAAALAYRAILEKEISV